MIDWEAIKTEYITTDLSYRQLGQKHGLSHQMIAVRGKSGGWVELRRQYKAKVTAKTVDKMASKKASQRARVADLADKLLDKLEQAIDELDLRTTAYKVKTVEGNREEVVEYQEATQGGVVSRAGLRQLTAALKDLKEVKDIVSELDKKEQEARIAALQSRSVTVDDDEDETGVILLPPRLEGTDHG